LSDPQSNLRPKQIETRFLYPFFFERDKASEASNALSQVTIAARNGQLIDVWECCEPPAFYKEELLDHVQAFLFENTTRGCRYLRVSNPVSSRWFNKLQATLIARKPPKPLHEGTLEGIDQRGAIWPISLAPLAGIEVFFTNYGVGLLSIGLTPDKVELDFENTTLFNYKLAQFRPKIAALLGIQHPSENEEAWQHMSAEQRQRIAPAPPDNATVSSRLGVPGGSFLLGELVTDVLLKPLSRLALVPIQEQFSVYTVVRFGDEVDFDCAETTHALAAFLSAVTQIEEPSHAGSRTGVVDVTNEILNRRHWAAVGLLGMTHIVSDQPIEGLSFNSQRVPRVMMKYFIPYLTALLQRMTLQRCISEASDLVLNQSRSMTDGLAKLRQHMLEFAVEGYFPEVSHREVIDRYYRMVQLGLGVRRAYEDVSRSITDIDARFAADHQAKLAEAMAENVAATRTLQDETIKMQHNVGLLERFIISVYAATLWEMLASHVDRLHYWIPHGVIGFAIAGFVGAWALEKLWRH